MKEIELKVNGMKCSGCENRICNVVKTVDGVNDVSASFESGKVIVKFDKDINKDEIITKIENLDFEVVKED